MSRTLRYYTICKLTIWSITVSWMLAEGTKLLDKKQRTVFAHSNNSSWSISICASFQSVNLRKVTGRGPDDSCTCNGLHYLRGTPYLGNQIVSLFALCPVGASSLLYWTVNKPTLCPSKAVGLLQTPLQRYSRTKADSVSACKMYRNRGHSWRIVFQQ